MYYILNVLGGFISLICLHFSSRLC